MDIIISDEIFGRIMKVIGYPIITLDDISGGLITKEQVLDYIFRDALMEYWSWFPIQNTKEYEEVTIFEIDFPNENTVGVVDARVSMAGGGSGGGFGSNAFATLKNCNSIGSTSLGGRGLYGTRYDYGSATTARTMQRMAMQANKNSLSTLKVNVDSINRKVTGYNNYGGRLNITWAEVSGSYLDVPFNDLQDVIKLSQAYLLFYFGDLRNQTADNTPSDIDGSDFISRAEDLRKYVIERWEDRPKIVVVKG